MTYRNDKALMHKVCCTMAIMYAPNYVLFLQQQHRIGFLFCASEVCTIDTIKCIAVVRTLDSDIDNIFFFYFIYKIVATAATKSYRYRFHVVWQGNIKTTHVY